MLLTIHLLSGTNASWPCHDDEEDAANSDSKTVNSDIEFDTPYVDLEGVEEFPEIDFEETEIKSENKSEPEKELEKELISKSGDSLQSSMWINPNERDLEDLKK